MRITKAEREAVEQALAILYEQGLKVPLSEVVPGTIIVAREGETEEHYSILLVFGQGTGYAKVCEPSGIHTARKLDDKQMVFPLHPTKRRKWNA